MRMQVIVPSHRSSLFNFASLFCVVIVAHLAVISFDMELKKVMLNHMMKVDKHNGVIVWINKD